MRPDLLTVIRLHSGPAPDDAHWQPTPGGSQDQSSVAPEISTSFCQTFSCSRIYAPNAAGESSAIGVKPIGSMRFRNSSDRTI